MLYRRNVQSLNNKRNLEHNPYQQVAKAHLAVLPEDLKGQKVAFQFHLSLVLQAKAAFQLTIKRRLNCLWIKKLFLKDK